MYNEPVSFKAATDQMAARLDTPTAMRYKEITAAWDAQFRRRAFFSARVAEADLLGELHRKAQAVADGRMTKAQARRLIREFFVGDGADALAALGFAPPKDAKGISQLASIPRLELIVDTNVRMAQETGHYKKWESLKDVYPYGMWRVGYSKVHREAHLERDGKVYAFDHPIWRESPPGGEFNCHCRRELMTARELAASGKMPVPDNVPFQPSSLGFDPGADSWGDVPFGKTVTPSIKKEAEKLLEQDLTAEAKNLALERMDERQAVIDELAQYVGQLETREDEMARGFVADAERQYDEMYKEVNSLMENMPVNSEERKKIVERWAQEDEETKDILIKEINELKTKEETARLLNLDAEHQKINFYIENKQWILNLMNNEANAKVAASVAREYKGYDWLTTAETKAAATHEINLLMKRTGGTLAQLYRFDFRELGARPIIVLEKDKMLYEPSTNEIHMARRFKTRDSQTIHLVHEFGHWLDFHSRLSENISKALEITQEDFIERGKIDTGELLKKGKDMSENIKLYGHGFDIGTYWETTVFKALFNTEKKFKDWTFEEKEIMMYYMDTMQNITYGMYGSGHSLAYARQQYNVGKEAFAQTYVAYIRKDKHFGVVYPKMWDYFSNLLSKINKKWG